ncbi:MAG: hypothetical protein ACTSU2_06145 [Promethearchaeota archaeon]
MGSISLAKNQLDDAKEYFIKCYVLSSKLHYAGGVRLARINLQKFFDSTQELDDFLSNLVNHN